MSAPRTIALAALILLAMPAALAQAALDSPRATFETFLSAMNDVREGRDERYDDALACLDLSQLPAILRSAPNSLARDLKLFLDKHGRVDLEALPTEVGTNRYTYLRTAAGEVSLTVQDDGRWLFSPETVGGIDRLLASMGDRAIDPSLGARGGVPPTPAEWLRERMPEPLRERALYVEIWQWFGLLAVALVGVLVDRLLRILVGAWLRRLLRSSATLRKAGVVEDFEKPIGILAMALTWMALLPLLGLPAYALSVLLFAARFVAALAGVWAVYKLVDVASAHFLAVANRTETQIDDVLVPLVRRALKIVVVAFGLLFVARNLDIDVTGLIAGLGIGGLAFALAAKDTVENLFGSVTVLIDRPFSIGDWVMIEGNEGTVEEIGLRSTRIRTFYNSRITVPNKQLVSSAVDNLGARRYRRYKAKLGVQYDTPPERVDAFCEGIRELIRRHPYTRKDFYAVYFNDFGPSSLDLLVYMFFETPDWSTELRERHRFLVDIVRLAHKLGVQFAFPTQTLHLSSVPEGFAGAPAAGVPTGPDDRGVALGRDAASAIVSALDRETAQTPVDYADPERVAPDR